MGGATCRHSSGEDLLLAMLLIVGLWTSNCGGVMRRANVTRETVISIRQMEESCSNLPLYAKHCGDFCLSNFAAVSLFFCSSSCAQPCSASYMTRSRTLDAT